MPTMDPRSLDKRAKIIAQIMLRGGRWQIKRPELEAALEMKSRILGVHLQWLEEMKVIKVERSASSWSEGRNPNVYVALMSEKEFRKRADELYSERLLRRRMARGEKTATRVLTEQGKVAPVVPPIVVPPKPGPVVMGPSASALAAPTPIGSATMFDALVRQGLEDLDPDDLAAWGV